MESRPDDIEYRTPIGFRVLAEAGENNDAARANVPDHMTNVRLVDPKKDSYRGLVGKTVIVSGGRGVSDFHGRYAGRTGDGEILVLCEFVTQYFEREFLDDEKLEKLDDKKKEKLRTAPNGRKFMLEHIPVWAKGPVYINDNAEVRIFPMSERDIYLALGLDEMPEPIDLDKAGDQ